MGRKKKEEVVSTASKPKKAPKTPSKAKRKIDSEIVLPKSFNILGDTYKVSYVDTIECETGFLYGETDSVSRTIKIALKNDKGEMFSARDLNITLWHEISHAILFAGQYNELAISEALVEWLGRSISSILSSAEYSIIKVCQE